MQYIFYNHIFFMNIIYICYQKLFINAIFNLFLAIWRVFFQSVSVYGLWSVLQYYIGDSTVLVYLLQVESTITPPEPPTPSTRQRPTPQTLPGQWDTPPPQVCLVSLPFVQQQDFFKSLPNGIRTEKTWM